MNQTTKFWMTALRWTLGIVVLTQSCLFVFSSSGRHAAGEIGMPQWIRPVLGGSEIVAALLFLVPATSVAGGYLLLVVFFFAAAIHVLHGQYDVAGLIVYAVAVMACIAAREGEGFGYSSHENATSPSRPSTAPSGSKSAQSPGTFER